MRPGQTIFIMLLSSALFVTCKDDDGPKPPACKLTSFESGTVRFTYQYDGDVLTSRNTTATSNGAVLRTVTYGYDDAGNVVSLTAPGEVGTLTYTSGQITRMEFTGEMSFSQTDYEYSGERLVRIQYYEPSGFEKANYTTLEYSGSNVTVARTFSQNGNLQKVEQFKHGDNYSPFAALPETHRKLLKLDDFSVGNNLTSYENTDGVEIEYVSEFNSYGFATKIVSTINGGAPDTRVFTYECSGSN